MSLTLIIVLSRSDSNQWSSSQRRFLRVNPGSTLKSTYADLQHYPYRSNSLYPEHGIGNVCRSSKSLTNVNDVADHQANGDTLPADQTFTMQLAVQGMVMGMSFHPIIDQADS